jgi:methyltransferase (TIGR00027 family)
MATFDTVNRCGKKRFAECPLAAARKIRLDYTASRTQFFDDFFVSAANAGVSQVVILAAGLDARAWRLPWPDGVVVYEIDQPEVLQFKQATLQAHHMLPNAGHVAVPVDLRDDWPKALREAGFSSSRASAWSAKGLLPYLLAEAQDLLFDRVHGLSAVGSCVAVEVFDDAFFEPANLERLQAQYAADMGGQAILDFQGLWQFEQRSNVIDWLNARGWRVNATSAHTLIALNHRLPAADVTDAIPKTTFVEGYLTDEGR